MTTRWPSTTPRRWLEDSGATTIDVLANDTDDNLGSTTITGKTDGAHGTVAITNAGADLTYTPDANYCNDGSPTDDFTYTLNGGSTATVHVTVTCADDAPDVDLDTGTAGTDSTATFLETNPHAGTGVLVAPNAQVTDADDANIESATITLTNHPDGDSESLSATIPGGSGITGGSYDSSTGVLSFTGSASKADYATLIASIRYDNIANPPSSVNRIITVEVNDGDHDSNSASAVVTVIPLNAAPVVDLNGTGTAGIDVSPVFTEGAGAATLAPVADVTDTDDADLASATVTLTNRPDGGAESLSVNVAGTSITADAYVPGTGVLFLHGVDTKAHYQQVLRTVAYANTSDTPDTANRSITFVVNDGTDDSGTATADMSVVATNDAPTLDLNGAGAGANETATYAEDQPAVTLAPNTLASDPDNANLQSATVTLTNHPDGAAESAVGRHVRHVDHGRRLRQRHRRPVPLGLRHGRALPAGAAHDRVPEQQPERRHRQPRRHLRGQRRLGELEQPDRHRHHPGGQRRAVAHPARRDAHLHRGHHRARTMPTRSRRT